MMLSMQSEDLIEQNLVERGAGYVLSGQRYVCDGKLHLWFLNSDMINVPRQVLI